MKTFFGAGLMALFIAIAAGICSFFGIINAEAILHPNATYRKIKLVVVKDQSPNEPPVPIVKIYPEAGCKDDVVLPVIWSLRHQPDIWSLSHYELSSAGVSIWVGNEDYGLKINQSDDFSKACRSLLYSVTRHWTHQHAVKAVGHLTNGDARRADRDEDND